MRGASHTFFDHTGDFGADLAAPTREALYEEVARALVDLVTDAPASVREAESRPLEAHGVDPSDLLVALGNELLFALEADNWLAARIDIEELDDASLRATAHGEAYDPERHPIARPVKAVTHHGAEVREQDGGWVGRLIFDL